MYLQIGFELDYTVANNIFWENTAPAPVDESGDVYLVGGDWDSFSFANNGLTSACREDETLDCAEEGDFSSLEFTETSGNLHDKNPWFEDTDAGDYRLGSVSLLVGAASDEALGFPDEDFEGYDMNEPPDMGAFQLQTSDGFPTAQTGVSSNTSRTQARVKGIVIDDGTGELVRAGVLVGTAEGDYSLSFASTNAASVEEVFSATPSSLACGTEYHYVAFGKTDIGTGYGQDETFATESCRGGGGGRSGRNASSAPDAPTTTAYPTYDPIYNPATGHWEAPDSTQAGPSPYDGETQRISLVSPGWYIRSGHYDTVYYVDSQLHRQPLWDAQTYFTWQDSFDSIVWVTDATLQTLSLGTPLLHKPDVVLVKISDQPSVYAVGADGLRQIPDEATATGVYGTGWADYVLDIPPILFPYFGKGTPVSSDEHADMTGMKKRTAIAAML